MVYSVAILQKKQKHVRKTYMQQNQRQPRQHMREVSNIGRLIINLHLTPPINPPPPSGSGPEGVCDPEEDFMA